MQGDCGQPISALSKEKTVWRVKADHNKPSTAAPVHADAELPVLPPSGINANAVHTSGLSNADKELIPALPNVAAAPPHSSDPPMLPDSSNSMALPSGGLPPMQDLMVLIGEAPASSNLVPDPSVSQHLPAQPAEPQQVAVPTALPQTIHQQIISPGDLQLSLVNSGLQLVDVEVLSAASSDNELDVALDDHHSDPTNQATEQRKRKPYTKQNYDQSSMVTWSSVPSSPHHD